MAATGRWHVVHSGLPDRGLAVGMKFAQKSATPRRFAVGNADKIEMRDCGTLAVEPHEQVTLGTERRAAYDGGAEYDVARKDWGFYATPSLNGRLESFGLRGVLIRNTLTERYFVLLVERGHEDKFSAYMAREGLEIVVWLDSTTALDRLYGRLRGVGLAGPRPRPPLPSPAPLLLPGSPTPHP